MFLVFLDQNFGPVPLVFFEGDFPTAKPVIERRESWVLFAELFFSTNGNTERNQDNRKAAEKNDITPGERGWVIHLPRQPA
jgi:hypothetical protein